jgi:hypothetical protein
VAWLRRFGETPQQASVPQEQAGLLHAIYEQIVVAGGRLTYANPPTPTGFAWRVAVRRRPAIRPAAQRPSNGAAGHNPRGLGTIVRLG